MWTSKLGAKFPKAEIEALDTEHHRLLQRLRKEPCNAKCFECAEDSVAWASVNLGVFLCVRCADVHRALGTHLTKVKGCTGTYLWGPDEIARMQEVGNAVAAQLYCGGGAPTPAPSATKEERVELCRKKYELRLWAGPPAAATTAAVRARPVTTAVSPVRAVASRISAAPAPPVARPAADLDFEAMFAEFANSPVSGNSQPSSGPASLLPSSGPAAQLAGASNPEGQVPLANSGGAAATGAAATDDLDKFLSLCLGEGAVPAPAVAAAVVSSACLVTAASATQRVETTDLWADFGEW